MDIFLQQKKFITSNLDSGRFDRYVTTMEEEVLQVLRDDPGFDTGCIEALIVMSEVVLRTSTAALQGPEVRACVAREYGSVFLDLCGGMTPLHWMFKNLPLPSYRKRDAAHAKMRRMYLDVIEERRRSGSAVSLLSNISLA